MLSVPSLFPVLLLHGGFSMLKAAAISLPSRTVSTISPEPKNETSTMPKSLPYLGNNPYCSNSIIWTGLNTLDDHFLRDCGKATDKFENFVSSFPKPDTRFEFVDPQTPPMQRLPKMETPRRYASRRLKAWPRLSNPNLLLTDCHVHRNRTLYCGHCEPC